MATLTLPITPGQRALQRFELVEYLPSGRLGELWTALDLEDGAPVVVRVASPYLARDPEFCAAFLAAGGPSRRIRHPNVARVVTSGIDEGLGPVLVAAWVPGEPLTALLRGGPPPTPAEIARIGVDLCEGLKALHERGILHGDLRPSAVRLGWGGRGVLLDAGMPRPWSRPGDEISPRSANWEYTAPEIAFDAPDQRSDLYSVAAVLQALVVGRPPLGMGWTWEDPAELPSRFAEVLTRALDYRAERRFPTAGVLAAELAAVG